MRLDERSRGVHAERWVHTLLATQTFALVLLTLWAIGDGLAHGLLVLAVVPALLVALSGWMTAAWRRGQAWAWGVATIVAGLRFVGTALAMLDGEVPRLGWALLLFDGLLLAFLSHPACRARLQPSAAQVVGAGTGPEARRPASPSLTPGSRHDGTRSPSPDTGVP